MIEGPYRHKPQETSDLRTLYVTRKIIDTICSVLKRRHLHIMSQRRVYAGTANVKLPFIILISTLERTAFPQLSLNSFRLGG